MSMTLMFSFSKNTSLACNIKDGEVARKAAKDKKEPLLKGREKLFMVTEMPSFSDYFAYMYFCGSAISGPWFEFKDLYDFFRAQGHYKRIHEVKTVKPAMERFALVWVCVIVGTIIGELGYDLSVMTTPAFTNQELWQQFVYIWVVM